MTRPFTMQEFASAWFAFKLSGPHPFTVGFDCEDHITRWLLPPGNATNCRSETFGHLMFTLWSGTSAPNPIRTRGRHFLFEQEAYVYRMEMRSAVTRALEKLFKVNPLPRNPGHAASDTMPKPEDFKWRARGWKSVGLPKPDTNWLKFQKQREAQLQRHEREFDEMEQA